MQHPARTLAAIGLALVSFSAAPAEQASPDPSKLNADYFSPVVAGATPAEREMVDWALGRFEAAGLGLPALKVVFHNGADACNGFNGYYRSQPRSISMCNRGDEKTTPAHTLLHEMAHGWAEYNLTEAQRQAFMEHRNVDHWSSADPHSLEVPWWQRGYEQAAELMAWGLSEGPLRSIWLHTELCDELRQAFLVLTGIEPLNQSTEYCKCQDEGSIYLRACSASDTSTAAQP